MCKQDFLDAGYKPIKLSQLDYWAKEAVQKDVRDEHGVKYYITVYFPAGEIPAPTAKVQFHIKESVMNLEHWRFESVESMEAVFEAVWDKLQPEYYEITA